MIIGGITLPEKYNPLSCTYPRARRSIAAVRTYTGVAVFDWGAILAGEEIALGWKSMTKTLFDQLDAVYQAGADITWESGIGGKIYIVKIGSLDGTLLFDAANEYMLDITMAMVILREVLPE